MPGNTAIPLHAPLNRRSARRLRRFMQGFAECSVMTLIILWLCVAPRATETTENNTMSIWIPNTVNARSFAINHLSSYAIPEQEKSIATFLAEHSGPWTIVITPQDGIKTIQTPKNFWGVPSATRTRWLPQLPWYTGQGTIKAQNKTHRTHYTQKNNELIVHRRLLSPTPNPTTKNTPINITLPAGEGDFWNTLQIPLTFPGLRALAQHAGQETSSIVVTQEKDVEKIQISVNAPLTRNEGRALIQDIMRGTNNVTEENPTPETYILQGEKNGAQGQIVSTPTSTSVTYSAPQEEKSAKEAYCRTNATARISSALLKERELVNIQTPTFILETVGRKTIVCFVDN